MKKLITILCLVFGLGVILSPIANAEEVVEDTTTEETPNEDEVIEEEFITTDLGEFFEEEVAPYLIDAGISLIGFIVSVLILWLKNKGSILNLNEKISTAVETNQNDISRNLALTNEINTKTQEEIRVLREEILVENKELKEEINRLNIERNRLYEDNQRIQNINNDIISLKKSLKILAVNDPKLVANGQAKLLAKELETNGEEQGI
jgi:hypothetical protein